MNRFISKCFLLSANHLIKFQVFIAVVRSHRYFLNSGSPQDTDGYIYAGCSQGPYFAEKIRLSFDSLLIDF